MKAFKYGLIGCGALLVLGLVAIFSILSVAVEQEQQRWVPVQGRVVSVERLCKIAGEWRDWSSRDRSQRPWNRSPALDCEAAREAVARQPQGGDARVIPAAHVTYSYVSPVDRRTYRGQLDIERWYPEGGTIPVTQGASFHFWDPNPSSGRALEPGELDPADPQPGTTLPVDADREQAAVSRYGTAHF
jgi:hypothetical protein